MIKPIETHYKGYRFRSRLEARWAVFFETLGCDWEYEPEGFDLHGLWYLPDFRVRYPNGEIYWFEVKSHIKDISDDELLKISEFARLVDDIHLLDGPPEHCAYIPFFKTLSGLVGFMGDEYYERELSPESFDITRSNRIILENNTNRRTRFGNILWDFHNEGRMWICDRMSNYIICGHYQLDDAITASRSARFENRED